ncbi:MAG: hypothetical protein ABIM99_06165 [Candidatus Dojkabacteria bacterium]
MRKIFIFFLALITISVLLPVQSFAQDLDSTTYRLVAPSTGESASGIQNSGSYSALTDSSPVDDFTTTSTTYKSIGGTAAAIEANVPSVVCFETNTSSGTCSIGTNGLQEVCSTPGCYDRAKFQLNGNSNPADTRYAVQISTDANFTSSVYYLDPVSRTIKTGLNLSDFIYECDWEGTALASYCASANTTFQRYNILGLIPATTYYLRISALHGDPSSGSYTQSSWSTTATASTQNTTLSVDVDIASSTAGSSSPPYIINLGTMTPNTVTTSTNYIIFRLSTNAISGIIMNIKGTNGGLLNGASLIANVNADLASNIGYGLRNDSTTNSSSFTTYLGSITVSSTPSNFQDGGGTDRVGSPTTSFVTLFTSNGLALHTGVSGYKVKAKPNITNSPGSYSETLTYIPIGSF